MDCCRRFSQNRAPDADTDGPPGTDPNVTTTVTTTTVPPTTITPTTTASDPKTSSVTAVRVPTIPMPTWAVIRLYEARDAASLKDADTAKLKLQDVIIWVESVTQGQQ